MDWTSFYLSGQKFLRSFQISMFGILKASYPIYNPSQLNSVNCSFCVNFCIIFPIYSFVSSWNRGSQEKRRRVGCTFVCYYLQRRRRGEEGYVQPRARVPFFNNCSPTLVPKYVSNDANFERKKKLFGCWPICIGKIAQVDFPYKDWRGKCKVIDELSEFVNIILNKIARYYCRRVRLSYDFSHILLADFFASSSTFVPFLTCTFGATAELVYRTTQGSN